MAHKWRLHFLTLVLPTCFSLTFLLNGSTASAAPVPLAPNIDEPEVPDPNQTPPKNPELIESVDITPPPAVGQESDDESFSSEYFYPYRKSMSPRLGIMYNSIAASEGNSMLYAIGFQTLWSSPTLKNYEAGADLISDGTGRVNFQQRWFFSRSRMRPYAKAGAGLKLTPKDGLATILKLANYNARAAIGLERLFLAPLSLRVELEVGVGIEDVEALLSFGYSWAW